MTRPTRAVLAGLAAAAEGIALASAPSAGAATPGTLPTGAHLFSGATLTSPRGAYRLVMQTDGNLVERRVTDNAAIWTSRTAGHAGAALVVQSDGNVVIYPKVGGGIWSTRTTGNGNALALQDDGNLVVRSAAGRALWTTGADHPAPPAPRGDVLYAGGSWTYQHPSYDSPSGEFSLYLSGGMVTIQQDLNRFGTGTWSAGRLTGDVFTPTLLSLDRDGNLVLTAAGHVQWTTNTAGSGANSLSIQDDGNLVLRTAVGRAVWSSGSGRAILYPGRTLTPGAQLRNLSNVGLPWATATMQSDGNFVLRYGSGVVWSSNTHVAGSRLVMQTDGNAVVRAPSGAAVWSTATSGHPGAVLLIGVVRDLQVTGGSTYWHAV
ncbi:hypothetical protein ACXR2U_11830 [Jatrophihabitans sp. YIM 134969]